MSGEDGRLVAGRYQVSGQIGRGGMGTVWLATDRLLDRQVAVKKLHFPAHLDEEERARLSERMHREARSAARVRHPAVIVVHDVVQDDGLPCIVMEHVPSRALGDVLREEGPLSPEEASRVGQAMAAALYAAHAVGVLHRDVKPGNVLLGEGGRRVVLTDFGIAAASGMATLTRTGEFVGSINYTAPERMQGGKAGEASDAWALGATLYEAVEGEPPFRRATWVETAYATASDPPPPMQNAGALAPLIEGLLAKEPEERLTLKEAEARLAGIAPTTPAELTTWRQVTEPTVAREVDRGADRVESRGADRRVDGPARAPQAARPPRRTGRPVVWASCAVALTAVVAAGGWWMGQDGQAAPAKAGPTASQQTHTTPDASPSPSARPPTPQGYHRVQDPLGFSVDIPDGWNRKAKPAAGEADYLSPDGRKGFRFSVLDFSGGSPLRHWRELEPAVREKSPGYERLRMNGTTYQGRPAALWEYRWQGRARVYHAIDLGFGEAGKRDVALYLSAPDAQWAAAKEHFDTAVASFRLRQE